MSTYFNHILGNDHIKQYLSRITEKGTINNSLLFSGPEGIGKSLFAESFAKLILETKKTHHPDIHHYHPEGKIGMHTIDSMRQFCSEVYLAPFEGKRKVFIIHDAERMLTYSANALLKTFEEPSPDSVIILISSAPELLLTTVLSRCRVVHFHHIDPEQMIPLLQEKFQKSFDEAKIIAYQSNGSIGQACRISEKGGSNLRKQILDQLSKGKMTDYQELKAFAQSLSKIIEDSKGLVGDELRGKLSESFQDQLTSIQKQNIEKEVEGAISLEQSNAANELFNIILMWYRDLHLLSVNGNPKYLFHKDYEDKLEQTLQKGNYLSLKYIQNVVNNAKTLLQRSTALNICLENLFLKLNLI